MVEAVRVATDVSPETLTQATAKLRAELPALRKAAIDDEKLQDALDRAQPILILGDTSANGSDVRAALEPLLPALRSQTAARSAELGNYWDALNILAAAAIALAATTMGLALHSRFVWASRAQDNIDRLQAQLLRADRLAALGTLAATVAHEINNPLSYVLTNLDLLRDRTRTSPLRAAEADVARWLADAQHGAQRVATIVRDLRNLSHPGASEPHPRLDVHAPLEAAIRITQGDIRDRARIRCDFQKVPAVEASDAHLGQVFLNLIVNAAQAIERGDPQLNEIVVSTRFDAKANEVVVSVEDTGRGIDAEHAERMFEAFVTTKRVGEGTGLGLYVCRGIIDSLGGTIELRRASSGRGTEAVVRLPAARATVPARREQHTPVPAHGRKLRILIIDDEPMLAEALARSLHHHDVTTATRGNEAVELARQQTFDLVLCDLVMPEMSGSQVFNAMHAHDPANLHRFVFMTGAAVTAESELFASRVPAPILHKPFSRSELETVIRKFSQ